MEKLMKYISRIHRAGNSYRFQRLTIEGLIGHQHIYIYHICKNPEISQDQLAQLIGVNKSNVTRQIVQLEQNGFVVREPSAQDKRMIQVSPTEKAIEIYPQICELFAIWNELLMEELNLEETEIIMDLLKRISNKAQRLVQGENGEE